MDFLKNHPELEKELGDNLDPNLVIVKKKDWEKVRSAIAFNRIKIVNEDVVSITNFLFNIEESVKVKNKIMKVSGRLEWYGFENEYILVPPTNEKYNLKNFEQVPESKINKFKK